jgi:hypothetical protein
MSNITVLVIINNHFLHIHKAGSQNANILQALWYGITLSKK